ncbi:MAG TPA: hypothetical protein VGL81_05130 [Polyangiaceae bacterium]|jgi:hypothetical protein
MTARTPVTLLLAALAAALGPMAACGGVAASGGTSDAGEDGPVSADVFVLPLADAAEERATDAGLADSAPAMEAGPFTEAPHSGPVVTANGGPVLASPLLVTVTYADDMNRATEEALGAFMVKSSWLATVGKEYGVGNGTSANVELTQTSPVTIDDSTIQSQLASLIADGTAPDPRADGGAESAGAVYMFYFPTTTAVTIDGSTLCDISGGGYHYESEVNANGHSFAYAVVSPCQGLPAPPPENIVWAASHELIEAATDPYFLSAPGYVLLDETQAWSSIGGEVGDLCTYLLPQWSEGPYTFLQRVYSNASVAAGGDPCIPSTGPFFGTDVEPQTFVAVPAGKSTTFQVKGWSTAEVGPWSISAASAPLEGTATASTSLVASTLENGQTTTLTVEVPPGTASQTYFDVFVTSEGTGDAYTTALGGVYVP